jgi:hypothetical protein
MPKENRKMASDILKRVLFGCAVAASSLLHAATADAVEASLPLSALVVSPSPNSNTVTISVDNATGFLGAVFAVEFDTAVLSPTDVVKTGITANCSLVFNTGSPTNQVRISIACTNPMQGGGPVADISFDGVSDGVSALTFVECQFDEQAPDACDTNDGEIIVTDCPANVDGKGPTAFGFTDGVYIYRSLIGLGKIVPDLHRQQDPTIPSDDVIDARIDSIKDMLDVDKLGGVSGFTDGIYIYRRMIHLGKVVPDLHRSQNPAIPSDEIVGGNVDDLCQ